MPTWNAFSFAFGPVFGLCTIGIMVVILRWAFARGQSVVERPAKNGNADDYGLLVPIAAPSNYIEGEMIRRELQEVGIRTSLATTTDGPRILVWREDEEKARSIVKQNLG